MLRTNQMSEAKQTLEARLTETFRESVKAQINDDRQHGWGIEDSRNVIVDVICEDASAHNEEKPEQAYSPSKEAVELMARVINPSAFRQRLESAKRPDGQTVLQAAEKGTRGKRLEIY